MNKNKKVIIVSIILILLISLLVFLNSNKDQGNISIVNEANKMKQKFVDQLPGLEKLAKENPQDASISQQLGVAKYATGDIEGAKQAYETAINIEQDNAVSHNNLGNVYRDMGDFENAEKEYLKAIELDKRFTKSYLNLGSVYTLILNKQEKAINIYEIGIEYNPEYVDLYNNLAHTYEKMGDIENAKKYYSQSLQIKEDNPAATRALERLNN